MGQLTPNELQNRTKQFALRVMKLANTLTSSVSSRELGRQLVRSGMSVSANYRAARRARSRREFIAKIGVVAEEADETQHWLELLCESGLVPAPRMKAILAEAGELVGIFSKTRQTAKLGAKKTSSELVNEVQLRDYQISKLGNQTKKRAANA